MKHIFYLIGIIAIIHELYILFSPIKHTQSINRIKKLQKDNVKMDEWTNGQRNYCYLGIMYWIYVICGLMSFQWIIYLAIMVLSVIPKPHWTLKFIDAAITLFLLIFAFINAYHLNIGSFEMIHYITNFFTH